MPILILSLNKDTTNIESFDKIIQILSPNIPLIPVIFTHLETMTRFINNDITNSGINLSEDNLLKQTNDKI